MVTRLVSWIPYTASTATRVDASMYAFLTSAATAVAPCSGHLYCTSLYTRLLCQTLNLQAPRSRGTLYRRRAGAVAPGGLFSTSVHCCGFRFCFRHGALLADCQDLHEIIVRELSAAIQHARTLARLVSELFRHSAFLGVQSPPLGAEPLDLVCGRVRISVCEEGRQAVSAAPRRGGVRDLSGHLVVPVALGSVSSVRPVAVCVGHGAAAAPDALLPVPTSLNRAPGNVLVCHKRYVRPGRRVASATPIVRTCGTRTLSTGPPVVAMSAGTRAAAGSTMCNDKVRPRGKTWLSSVAVGLRGAAAAQCWAPRCCVT